MSSRGKQADCCVRCLVDEIERAASMIWQALSTDGNVSTVGTDEGCVMSERSGLFIRSMPWRCQHPASRCSHRSIELHYASHHSCSVAPYEMVHWCMSRSGQGIAHSVQVCPLAVT